MGPTCIIQDTLPISRSLTWAHMQKSLFPCKFTPSWRRQWQPTPVLLPGTSHGWRSLVGWSPWGCCELDTTERLHFHFSLSCIGEGNGNPLQRSCLENPRDRGAWWVSSMGSHRVRHDWSNLAAAAAVTPSQLLRIRTIFRGYYYSVSYTKVSRALRFRMADKVCHSSKSLIPWAVSQGDYAESSEINSDSVCNGWQSILSCGTRS